MEHGTTLSGLMHHHGTDPHAFLDFVHDISLERISPDPELNADIRALPGRRLIFTNGDAAYASRVLERLDLVDAFEFIHDIHACQYVPKPDRSEEHTSELQSLMRISYAVFCLKKKKKEHMR